MAWSTGDGSDAGDALSTQEHAWAQPLLLPGQLSKSNWDAACGGCRCHWPRCLLHGSACAHMAHVREFAWVHGHINMPRLMCTAT